MSDLNSHILVPGFVLVGWTFLISVRHYLTQKKAAKNRDVEYRYFKTYSGDAPDYLHQSGNIIKTYISSRSFFILFSLGNSWLDPVDSWISFWLGVTFLPGLYTVWSGRPPILFRTASVYLESPILSLLPCGCGGDFYFSIFKEEVKSWARTRSMTWK